MCQLGSKFAQLVCEGDFSSRLVEVCVWAVCGAESNRRLLQIFELRRKSASRVLGLGFRV
jgi:hypothetical protein